MYSKILVPNREYSLLIKSEVLEKYIEEISNGSKESLANLYEATKAAVYGFVLSILKNKNDAEDIFQDVYIKIYESAYMYKSKGKPLAWILTIAKNLCYMKLRKQKSTIDINEVEEFLIYDKKNISVDDKLILNAAFQKISNEERNIIMLHVLAGMKHHEIAKILELPLSTVLSKYHRAIQKLKNVLKEDIK